MGFLDSVRRGILLIRLNGKAAAEIAKDPNSVIYGWAIIIIAGLINLAVSSVFFIFLTYETIMFGFLVYIVYSLLWILVLHGLAKVFGGKSSLKDYFKAQSHVSLLGWLSIIAFIKIPFVPDIVSWLITIWTIVMSVTILKSVHKLSTGKAIVVAVALPVLLILLVIIGALAYFGVLSPDKFLPVS